MSFFKQAVVLAALVATMLEILSSQVAFAAVTRSPQNTSWRYFVSNSSSSTANQVKKMQLTVYYPVDATGNKTITMYMNKVGNACSPNIYGVRTPTSTHVLADYKISMLGISGTPSVTGECKDDGNKSITFSVTDALVDSFTGLKKVTWEIEDTQRADISTIVFYVQAPDAVHIGVDENQTVGLNTNGSCSGNASNRVCALVDDSIAFGTCEVPGEEKNFSLYDLNDSYQYGNGTSDVNFYAHIQEGSTKMPKASYSQSGFRWVSDFDKRWKPAKLDQEKDTITLGLKVGYLKPGTRYVLDIDDVSEANGFSLKFPLGVSEVFGDILCSNWSISPSTKLKVNSGSWTIGNSSVASVGDTIFWEHTFVNDGPTSTNKGISTNYQHIFYNSYADFATVNSTNRSVSQVNLGIWPSGQATHASVSYTGTNDQYDRYVVKSTDIGKVLCSRAYATPGSSQNPLSSWSNGGAENMLCVSVSNPYALTPSVTSSASVVSPGQSVEFTHHVLMTGGNGAKSNATWRTGVHIIVPPGVSVNASYNSISHGGFQCPAGATCTYPITGGGNLYNPGDNTETTSAVNTTGLPIGSRVCRVLSVDSSTQQPSDSPIGNTIANSAMSCALIAAMPYISVVGGDIWAGRSTPSPVNVTGRSSILFGSFAEYGAFATGNVSYFGSSGRLGVSTPGMKSGTRLTFANKTALGSFTSTHKISDLINYYKDAVSSSPSVMSGNSVANSGLYSFSSNGNMTISGMNAGNQKAIIYAPNGTVTIAGDIVYAPSGAVSFKDLPSLTVIAKNIEVQGNVAQISGNFYASGRFVTCKEGPTVSQASSAITTSGACSKQLVVNGTVTVANQAPYSLVFNRSYGGADAGQPAEMIRMRPESFLTPAENSLILTTVYETELPSRY